MGLTYKESGVDVQGGNNFVKRIGPIVRSTFTDRVVNDIGGFGSLYSAAFPEMKEPILVSGTDGVGTKLKIAQMMRRHDTIGIDAVAMCVNDIVVSGARPLFFLDYISCGRLIEDTIVDIVKGLAEGCRLSGCSLVGGETAEHPNVMESEDYDIAGFAVGVVDRSKVISGEKISKSDLIIGLPSSGIHSNGYSLVRKLFFDIKKYDLGRKFPDLQGTLGEELLKPTRIYAKSVLSAIEQGIGIKGIVHITGGGFYENIPRILPAATAAKISRTSFPIPPIFKIMQKEGEIEDREMFTTFNMGIGMMLVIAEKEAQQAIELLKNQGETPLVIGEIISLVDKKVMIQ